MANTECKKFCDNDVTQTNKTKPIIKRNEKTMLVSRSTSTPTTTLFRCVRALFYLIYKLKARKSEIHRLSNCYKTTTKTYNFNQKMDNILFYLTIYIPI